MKVWQLAILFILGLALIGYSFGFNYYQSQYQDIMNGGITEDYVPQKFESVEFILGNLNKIPLVKTDKINSLVSFNWGLAVMEESQTKSEKLLVKASQSSDPVISSNAHFNLGNMYVLLKQYKKALQEYKLAIKKNPDNTAAKYNWELLLRILKEKDKSPGKKGKKGEKDKGEQLIKIPGQGKGDDEGIGW